MYPIYGSLIAQSFTVSKILSLITLCAKLSGAVYCNRSCLWVCLFVGLLHDNSKLRACLLTLVIKYTPCFIKKNYPVYCP